MADKARFWLDTWYYTLNGKEYSDIDSAIEYLVREKDMGFIDAPIYLKNLRTVYRELDAKIS